MAVIAVDLGGTKVVSGIINDEANVRFLRKNLLNGRKGAEVGALITENIKGQISKAAYNKIKVTGIGICVPGSVDPETKRVWCPNIPGWEDFPLEEVIREEIGAELEIFVDSDRSCYAYGEIWQGAGQGCNNVVVMAVGTGIGAGIVIDGRPLHGACDIIGATGWMALEHPYDKKFDAMGCLEHYASGVGISNCAKKMVRANKEYDGYLRSISNSRITTAVVFEAYEQGDPIAREVIDKAITMWGMASANIVSLLNPEKVIWGGGVFGPAAKFIDRIYAEALKWGQPLSMRRVKFVHNALPGSAGLLGSGYLALNHGVLPKY